MVQSIEDTRRRQAPTRVPPHNLAAEESLLGAMLLSKDAIGSASISCTADDFYKPAHGHIFDAIVGLSSRGEPADPVTVAEELRRAELLDFIGGPATLVTLQAATPAISNASSYAKIVEEHALLRRLIGAAAEIAETCYSVPDDIEAAVDAAESLVFRVAQRKGVDTTEVLRQLLYQSLERIEALFDRGEAITGVPTGYLDIDQQLSGLQKSSLIIVGARPSMGKCVAWDTPIVDAHTGEVRTAAEVHRLGVTGTPVDVFSLGAEGQLRARRPSAFVDDGRKPVFRLRTKTGRQVRTTLTHPFLTPEGWRPLSSIGVGMRIAVPRVLPVFGPDQPDDEQIATLVHGLTDGVPKPVFRLAKPQLAFFLRMLMRTDGHTERVRDGVAFRTEHAALARDVQHLLLRFGVVSTVSEHVQADAYGTRWAVEVAIESPDDLDTYIAEIAATTRVHVRRRVLVGHGGPPPRAVDDDLMWDEVVSVHADGIDQVYDLTIPGDHNFVAADVLVHNTAFALGMAAHAAVKAGVPVLFFSLEMGHMELTQRLLCAEAQVDFMRIRNGRLLESDWPRITAATSRLGEAPLWIDDNPALTIMEVRAKARRLKSRLGSLGLIVIDYLQLMTGRNNAENRQVEIAEMSRGLKILARELEVPVVALSQLSRGVESRADKRPMLSDLRESGCLTGDTRVLRADTGAEVTMSELLVSGEQDVPVWTVDTEHKLVVGNMTKVFPSGIKPVFGLHLASGRVVRASANHPFLTRAGWQRLEELEVGGRVGVVRRIPPPRDIARWPTAKVILLAHLLGDGTHSLRRPLECRTADPAVLQSVRDAGLELGASGLVYRQGNWSSVELSADHPAGRDPVWDWLSALGLAGLRNRETFVPPAVFQLPDRHVSLFLRHLWASGSGAIGWRGGRAEVSLVVASHRVAEGAQLLLTRFGIRSRVVEASGDHRGASGWQVAVDVASQRRFLDEIGAFGMHARRVPLLLTKLPPAQSVEVDEYSPPRRSDPGLAPTIGAVRSQSRGPQVAIAAPAVASANIDWDKIVAIEPCGNEPVYDATVEGTHNFIANGITVHNSLEQDADVVMFIYRDEVYNPDSNDKGAADILVAKHRNGPTGVSRLVFHDRFTRFDNASRREPAV